jgi:hypothetical protein
MLSAGEMISEHKNVEIRKKSVIPVKQIRV